MDKIPKIDRQREHQANERTFLAWLRTSIALISSSRTLVTGSHELGALY
jgi:uncharacterized membrane protein YidH (DUF202 family)